MNFNKRLREKIQDSTFCYAKDGGEGFIHKDNCECGIGLENKSCQSLSDRKRFIKRFNDFSDTGKRRCEIIQIIKPEFKGSQWWKDNVVE